MVLRAPEEPAGAGVRIAVDLLGGDHAPAVVVDGALRACQADPEINLLLVGPAEVADELLRRLPGPARARVDVLPVRNAVGMADPPLHGLRADTTIRAAVAEVAEGRADALVTAGATGAAVTAVVHAVGRIRGVRRPALAGIVPALAGPLVLLDLGAGTEASGPMLVQHAALGAAYARAVLDLAEPRVALLSNGTEPGKGDRPRRAAEAVLREQPDRLPAGARFVGSVEGYDLTRGGVADVVVTDGFTGNLVIKAMEGAYSMALAHAGRPADQARQVGPQAAALLGVPVNAVVCHGSADGAAVGSGITLAARLHRLTVAGRTACVAVPTFLADVPDAASAAPDVPEAANAASGGQGEPPALEVPS